MELVNRYISLFGVNKIEGILADKEFIGDDWIRDLTEFIIKFYFRIKENMLVFVPGKSVTQAYQFFNYLPRYRAVHPNRIAKVGTQWVNLSGVKVLNKDGYIDFFIIATLCYDPFALTVYKDRWQIETKFRSLKTSGFNIEDTHLSDLERISKMLNLLCIAFI